MLTMMRPPDAFSLTAFWRDSKAVGAHGVLGEGARSLTIGDRATISNTDPEYATGR